MLSQRPCGREWWATGYQAEKGLAMIQCGRATQANALDYAAYHICALWMNRRWGEHGETLPCIYGKIWIARRDDNLVGALHLDEDPNHDPMVTIHADGPQAVRPLVSCIQRERKYEFHVPASLREELLNCLTESTLRYETVTLTLTPDRFVPASGADRVRRLDMSDMEMARRFPPVQDQESSVTEYLEYAAHDPTWRVYGPVGNGELLSYLKCMLAREDLWEASQIRTHPEHRRHGHAKAVLSHAAAELLSAETNLVYSASASNAASLATAKSVGFREVSRELTCTGQPKPEPGGQA